MDRSEITEKALRQIGQEWEVVAADGAPVGVVNEVHANFLWVQKGLLFPKDTYIPITVITSIGEGRVLLTVTMEEISRAGWDSMPETLSSV